MSFANTFVFNIGTTHTDRFPLVIWYTYISMIFFQVTTYTRWTSGSDWHDRHRDLRHNMGWLRRVGSWKLYVSFAECSLFYRALLQKRRIISPIFKTQSKEAEHRLFLRCTFFNYFLEYFFPTTFIDGSPEGPIATIGTIIWDTLWRNWAQIFFFLL